MTLLLKQMTISQMEKTMETMRSICGPKYNLKDELIDGSVSLSPLAWWKFDKFWITIFYHFRVEKGRVRWKQGFEMLHHVRGSNGRDTFEEKRNKLSKDIEPNSESVANGTSWTFCENFGCLQKCSKRIQRTMRSNILYHKMHVRIRSR